MTIPFISKNEIFWWYISYYSDYNHSGMVKYHDKKHFVTVLEENTSFILWGLYDIPDTILENFMKYKDVVEKDSIGFKFTLLNNNGIPLTPEEQKTKRKNEDNSPLDINPIGYISDICKQHGNLIGYIKENSKNLDENSFAKIKNYSGDRNAWN